MDTMPIKKYRLGLSLSGGGARGFAHIGVLQALEELGLKPDIISGTSAGAFAGVLYADGNKPKDIISFFHKKAFKEFAEFTVPKTGFFKSSRFHSFLKEHIKARSFEDLKIPLSVVATDIERGINATFSSGKLIPAVVASCSVPIVFTPVEIDGRHYVDGGLFKNFPVSVIRNNCDIVIGANVSPLTLEEYRESMRYIAERSYHYLSVSNTFIDRNLCDYLLEFTNLDKYSMFDLNHIKEIYESGYNFTMNYFKENKESLIVKFPEIKDRI